MKVFNEKENKTIKFDLSKIKDQTGVGLLKELNINPSSILLIKNDEVILPEEILDDKDEIKILSVISGG